MITFDFFEISGTSVRKVQGTARASAANRRRARVAVTPLAAKNRSKIDPNFDRFYLDFWDDFGVSRIRRRRGSAAEAWAVPCTFRTEVPEISKKFECNILSINNKMSPRGFTRRSSGSAAGLKTPAASHRPLPLRVTFLGCLSNYSFTIRSLFAPYL